MILLPALFALAAMAINLSYIQLVRSRVQIATDSATRAAGGAFSTTGDQAAALAAARSMAAANPIESVVLSIDAGDLEYGLSSRVTKNKAYSFQVAPNGNSVRLTTNSYANGAGDALKPVFSVFNATFDIRPVCTATHTQTTLDVGVVVDRSGSMRWAANEVASNGTPPASDPDWVDGDPAPPGSRWLDLVASVGSFNNILASTGKIEKVALSSYASTSATHQVLTDDYTLISNELNVISSSFQEGATNVGDGILEGLAAVSDPKYCRPWASNALVLMSDGNHNTGTDPIVAAQQAVTEGVPIYTVSFSAEANQTLMKQIADMTKGRHYHAVDAAQLNAAFESIARSLPSMLTQ